MAVASLQTEDVAAKTQVFHSILVATDFSEASRRALSSARALAAHQDAQVSVVHVFGNDWRHEMLDNPPEMDREKTDCEQRLAAWIQNFDSIGRIAAVHAKRGPVAAGVLSALHESAADLLVLGTRGRGGLRKLALGSVAEVLVRRATCPVMTVGPKAEMQNGEFHTILFATDYGPGSTRALPLVMALANTEKARLLLLHMISPIPATSASLSAYGPAMATADELQEWEGSSRQRSVQELRWWIRDQPTLHREPEYIVRMDFLPEGILTAANPSKADLIVMGANRGASPRLAAHLPWTAIHEVIQCAPCPVLTVAA